MLTTANNYYTFIQHEYWTLFLTRCVEKLHILNFATRQDKILISNLDSKSACKREDKKIQGVKNVF